MPSIVISDCPFSGEPGALATISADPEKPDELSAMRLKEVTALIRAHGADWISIHRARELRNSCRRQNVPLPGDLVVCACPELSAQRTVIILSARRRGRRYQYRTETVGRETFERRWHASPELAWRFLARFTE